MKKIMFDDRFWLTRSVLDGSKTMTRRVVSIPETWDGMKVHCAAPNTARTTLLLLDEEGSILMDEAHRIAHIRPAYRVGDVVAVAQRYSECVNDILANWGHKTDIATMCFKKLAGWTNKMFVKAELMPNLIRITDIRVERLQDITDEDARHECSIFYNFAEQGYEVYGVRGLFESPRKGFAALIDKISSKGTWEKNPWVFVYKFRLIK